VVGASLRMPHSRADKVLLGCVKSGYTTVREITLEEAMGNRDKQRKEPKKPKKPKPAP